ncbi:MAG: family 10 glycosylhydrolase [Paludibacter sp.]|nr:family 10 glycosylhydrolase [Paludibacter sp.]
MKNRIILLLFICISTILLAQPPKREMRAGWLATVYRIDWPTTPMTTVNATNIAKQKAEFVAILDSVRAANMNAVFFQIRPESDAFYNSAYEPWSAHLGGSRGTNPGYDPTAFAIEEAHKRGIELHAWLNPYRFETSAKKYAGQSIDYKALHPEWILDYAIYNTDGSKKTDGITILDPGNPAVRKLIKNVVGDILSKYDLDGIIFDDYFYAYSGTNSTLDSYSQNLYKPANMTLSNWRRDNVNKMVADVYDTIQAVKPSVIFGVSPFGIWTTSTTVATANGLTLPTGITGSNMYEQIYCDPVAWLQQGKVDYISPQLYWTTTSTGQDYKKLCPWWSDVVNKYSKYFYSSMSLTALTSSYKVKQLLPEIPWSEAPADLHELKLYTRNGGILTGTTQTEQRVAAATNFDDSEVGLEIDWNRNSTKNAAPGSVFYSIKNLWTKGNFTKYLREQKFTSPALTPAIYWKNHLTLPEPTNISITGNTLNWDYLQQNVRFTIYAVPNLQVGTLGAFTNVTNLLGITYTNQFDLTKYTALIPTHKFAVAALDRYGNEFIPSYVTTSTEIQTEIYRISIINNALQLDLEYSTNIELYSLNGVLIDRQTTQGTYKKILEHGVYLLKIGIKIVKVII